MQVDKKQKYSLTGLSAEHKKLNNPIDLSYALMYVYLVFN